MEKKQHPLSSIKMEQPNSDLNFQNIEQQCQRTIAIQSYKIIKRHKQTNKETNKQTKKQTKKQRNKQTNKQAKNK